MKQGKSFLAKLLRASKMTLSSQQFEELLPSYLHNVEKGRIYDSLAQFHSGNNVINYDRFYSLTKEPYLMQADVLNSVKGILWNEHSQAFDNGFMPAMILSNSCDMNLDNIRNMNEKNVLFAPLFTLSAYINDRRTRGGSEDVIRNFESILRRQEYTNLFYLPPNPVNKDEYIVQFDQISWLPISEIREIIEHVDEARFISLSNWGFYLFLVKLSLHMCRTPEEIERHEKN
jgi:hypothetical protein